MKPLFEINEIDREFYEKRLRDWLPDKIIDIHTHVWVRRFNEKKRKTPSRTVSWPSLVAAENPVVVQLNQRLAALQAAEGNQVRAARALGMSLSTLRRRLSLILSRLPAR